jgi:hypothetical protein
MTNTLEKRVKAEIDDLVRIGDEIGAAAGSSGSTLGQDWVITASSWVSRIGEIVRKLCGPQSKHMISYEAAMTTKNFYTMHSSYYSHIGVMQGVIKAVQHEFEMGLLAEFRGLVQADIFADFLEMGEYLLGEGYKDAAAVVIGSVLEDTLRKLAEANVNVIATRKHNGNPLTIDPLNVECAKAGIYDKLVQKQVTGWGDLRNKAAHGEYGEYDADQVRMMLLFVKKFASDYLGT